MTWHLQNEGHGVDQKRIRRLMRGRALDADLPEAQYQKAEEGV